MVVRAVWYFVLVIMLLCAGCSSTPSGNVVHDAGLPSAVEQYAEEAKVLPYEKTVEGVYIDSASVTSTVQHFSYDVDGVDVRFFLVKGSDSLPRVAFDACNSGKTGVVQDMTVVVCPPDVRFDIDQLGRKNWGSGTYPIHLPSEDVDGRIFIRKDDLVSGVSFFS